MSFLMMSTALAVRMDVAPNRHHRFDLGIRFYGVEMTRSPVLRLAVSDRHRGPTIGQSLD